MRNGKQLKAASLFSGSGIGDLGFRASGMNFVAMCELEDDRSALAELNFPEARHFADDVHVVQNDFCTHIESLGELFLLSCTAPCQGMSKNGKGTLLNNIRRGVRPRLDPRNRLILPALEIIRRLRPVWVVFENVTEMRNTVIEDDDGELRLILDIIALQLKSDGYSGEAYDVEFADYGIPQRRQRLITVYTRDPQAISLFESGLPLVPPQTHSKGGEGNRLPWVSVESALVEFTPLDGVDDASSRDNAIPFHYVPVLDPKKYEWIKHTPSGKSAFDNQCVNPQCLYQNNQTHGASHGDDGINRAHKHTPLYCERCGCLLPRPFTEEDDGKIRLMSGYTSAYKRMDGTLPAPALTRNLSYPCSDQKLHPTQNRVLSLAEAMRLQTIDEYEYKWGPLKLARGKKRVKKAVAPDTLIRLVIGESIPPKFLEILGKYIQTYVTEGDLPANKRRKAVKQPTLF